MPPESTPPVLPKTVLAPLAGVNCTAFRLMCRRYGADILYTQMYDVKIIARKSPAEVKNFLNILDIEQPVVIQLVGNAGDPWEKAAKNISPFCEMIDINLGCIEADYLQRKSGCYLMDHHDQIKTITTKLKSATSRPISAKIRSGWDKVNAVETALLLEKLGISRIAVHSRLGIHKYGGKADLDVIKAVKEAVSIPVIGSGDIILPGNAKSMVERTRCDHVMIGRQAMRNPKIFKQVKYLFENSRNMTVPDKDGIKLIKEFLKLYKKYEKRSSLREIKDHCKWFLSSTKTGRSVMEKIKQTKTPEELEEVISQY